MTSNSPYYNANDPKIAFISFSSEPSKKISLRIILTSHKKDELPIPQEILTYYNSAFHIHYEDYENTKFYIRLCISRNFLNVLIGNDIIIWNLHPSMQVSQLRDLIIDKLVENSVDKIKISFVKDQDTSCFSRLRGIVFNPLVRWCFKFSIKKSEFTLSRIIYNRIAKICMNKSLKDDTMKGVKYFDNRLSNYDYDNTDLINLIDKKDFLKLLMLIHPAKIYLFRENYLDKIHDLYLRFPTKLVNELRSYWPTPKELDYNMLIF